MRILVEHPHPHVALVTIDNPPKRNAMTRQMMADLAQAWDTLAAGPCRAIVITGAGDQAFNAGADIGGDLSVSAETARTVNRALLKNDAYPKPVIAAVNGVCAGGGVELLLSADIRFAAPHARFGLPEVKWSIYPFGGAASRLVHQIGHVHAMKLLLTAQMIDAEEARRIGLVNDIVPAATLLDTALATAQVIAANSPVAVQAVKAHVSGFAAARTRAQEADEQAAGDRVRASADFVEGVSAFRAKRAPRY